MSNELTELNEDQKLALAIKNGKIAQKEVEDIWKATSDLSPQTPIYVRRAMLAIRAASKDKQDVEAMAAAWPLFCQQVMSATTEMQAALMRDESRFSHLVAHTDDIVRELQKVGPLFVAIQGLRTQNEHLSAKLDSVLWQLNRPRWWQFWKRAKPEPDEWDAEEGLPQEPYNARIDSPYSK